MRGLSGPYPEVQNGTHFCYGGNQMLSPDPVIRKCGCGPVAAVDLILYLKHRCSPSEPFRLPLVYYNAKLSAACRRYFPLIPPFGINGLLFIWGLNRFLRDEALPYHARWCVSEAKLWNRAEALLAQDLPVIMSVGPNFPAVWEKHRLTFYRQTADGRYLPASGAKSHYITATGIDHDWLRIASWGQEFYIRRSEYDRFVKEHSTYLFSNLAYLEIQ